MTVLSSCVLTRARAKAFAQVVFIAAFMVVPSVFAADYPGRQALEFASKFIIAPLGLFSLVIALGAAFFRPEFVKQAIYSVIICAVLFFIINKGDQMFSALGK